MPFNPPRRPCRVDECTQMAQTVSRFCPRHLKAFTRHGHEEGRAIRTFELRPYRALAATLLKRFGDRRDVKAALQWLQKMLDKSPEDAAGVELQRLKSQGVTPAEMFRAALAVWAFHRDRPRSLPDDARLTYALGRTIVRLRRRRRVFARSSLRLQTFNVPPHAFAYVGLRIRECLPVLFERLIALEEQEHQQEAALRLLIREGDERVHPSR
jgi:hypothetical protein